MVYTLTPLGGLVWEFCDGTNRLEEIVNHITSIKQVGADEGLKEKIAVLLTDLKQAGLLINKDLDETSTLAPYSKV